MPPRTINKPRRVITDPYELPYLCTSAEAGLLLRKTPEAVNGMALKGLLPAAKDGNAWRFRRDDLLAYIADIFKEV